MAIVIDDKTWRDIDEGIRKHLALQGDMMRYSGIGPMRASTWNDDRRDRRDRDKYEMDRYDDAISRAREEEKIRLVQEMMIAAQQRDELRDVNVRIGYYTDPVTGTVITKKVPAGSVIIAAPRTVEPTPPPEPAKPTRIGSLDLDDEAIEVKVPKQRGREVEL